MSTIIKRLIPKPIKWLIILIKKSLFYKNYDSTAYWKRRAMEPDQASVMWKNQEYNDLYRATQKKIIKKYINSLEPNADVLDIGCGIGFVSKMMHEIREDIKIDAVDFSEMLDIAVKNNCNYDINYICSSAEEYFDNTKKYNLILSSGCYSAIRNIGSLERSLKNAIKMLDRQGVILMIDPFHRWSYLARAKYSSRDVIRYMKCVGELTAIEKSGVLFWPYRDWLANSSYSGEDLEKHYHQGERILAVLGKHFWADYKVLAFKKK